MARLPTIRVVLIDQSSQGERTDPKSDRHCRASGKRLNDPAKVCDTHKAPEAIAPEAPYLAKLASGDHLGVYGEWSEPTPSARLLCRLWRKYRDLL